MLIYMQKLLLILLCTACFGTVRAQQLNDVWIAFLDEGKDLYGFKDHSGNITIPPKFTPLIEAWRFNKIMAAVDENSGRLKPYVLLKNGTAITRYKPYSFDNRYDCESEGYLRVIDPKTNLMGMLNSLGNLAVPAAYNHLHKMENGFYIALQKAITQIDGEHRYWEGGEWSLYDKNNIEKIKNFADYEHLDFYSLQILDNPATNNIVRSYKGTDGLYYAFTDNLLLLKNFLNTVLDNEQSKEKWNSLLFEQILVDDDNGFSGRLTPNQFLTQYQRDFQRFLQEWKNNKTTIQKETDYYFVDPEMEALLLPYRNNCNGYTLSKHPLYTVSFVNGKEQALNTFFFLKTENGFQLVRAAVEQILWR